MGVHILHDSMDCNAVMYCSTTDWAFGPVFNDDGDHTASERAELFCEWLAGCDPRGLEDHQLETLYMEWRAQEKEQWATRTKADDDKYKEDEED